MKVQFWIPFLCAICWLTAHISSSISYPIHCLAPNWSNFTRDKLLRKYNYTEKKILTLEAKNDKKPVPEPMSITTLCLGFINFLKALVKVCSCLIGGKLSDSSFFSSSFLLKIITSVLKSSANNFLCNSTDQFHLLNKTGLLFRIIITIKNTKKTWFNEYSARWNGK